MRSETMKQCSKPISENNRHPPALLRFEDVYVSYGPLEVLTGIYLEVREGEIVCLLGGNASGKTTTLRAALGLVPCRRGAIHVMGQNIRQIRTSQIVRLGVGVVPEARRLFGRMSVFENLMMGAYTRDDRQQIQDDLEQVYELFPHLWERRNQLASSLSGGEQQMVALGRALMSHPKLLLMDEPSMGLSPRLVQANFDIIQTIIQLGTSVFLVEQNAHMALSIADRGYVLQMGKIAVSGAASYLRSNELVQRAYLGE